MSINTQNGINPPHPSRHETLVLC